MADGFRIYAKLTDLDDKNICPAAVVTVTDFPGPPMLQKKAGELLMQELVESYGKGRRHG